MFETVYFLVVWPQERNMEGEYEWNTWGKEYEKDALLVMTKQDFKRSVYKFELALRTFDFYKGTMNFFKIKTLKTDLCIQKAKENVCAAEEKLHLQQVEVIVQQEVHQMVCIVLHFKQFN